jgi:hypothetical protein
VESTPKPGRSPSSLLIHWSIDFMEAIGALHLTPMRRLSMLVLRGYLVIAVAMVIVRVVQTEVA